MWWEALLMPEALVSNGGLIQRWQWSKGTKTQFICFSTSMCFQVKKVTVNGHVILTVMPLWGSIFKKIQWMESSRLLVTGILHPLFSKITLCLVYTLFNNAVPCLKVHSLPCLVTPNGRMRLQRDMSSIFPLLSPAFITKKERRIVSHFWFFAVSQLRAQLLHPAF